ncbi:hypothetical protein PT286_10165 [Neisseriaceae bacterium ESL0693]|nr:hypothetical protein [Neisseriaceae bacterium ESL0693]
MNNLETEAIIEISQQDFIDNALNKISGYPLFNIKNYLGTMFYMDFGQPVTKSRYSPLSKKQVEFQCGEIILSIRDCPWIIQTGKQVTLNSHEDYEDDEFDLNFKPLLGRKILKTEIVQQNVIFTFEGGVELICDVSGQTEDDEYEGDSSVIAITFNSENEEYSHAYNLGISEQLAVEFTCHQIK